MATGGPLAETVSGRLALGAPPASTLVAVTRPLLLAASRDAGAGGDAADAGTPRTRIPRIAVPHRLRAVPPAVLAAASVTARPRLLSAVAVAVPVVSVAPEVPAAAAPRLSAVEAVLAVKPSAPCSVDAVVAIQPGQGGVEVIATPLRLGVTVTEVGAVGRRGLGRGDPVRAVAVGGARAVVGAGGPPPLVLRGGLAVALSEEVVSEVDRLHDGP